MGCFCLFASVTLSATQFSNSFNVVFAVRSGLPKGFSQYLSHPQIQVFSLCLYLRELSLVSLPILDCYDVLLDIRKAREVLSILFQSQF